MRAWRSLDRFEGRAALRRGSTGSRPTSASTCSAARERRIRPLELGAPRRARAASSARGRRPTWLEPIPDGRCCRTTATRREVTAERETLRLAFVAALQHLPPKQRAVLILREVLRWQRQRGGRAARDERRVGEQRAAARPRDARRDATITPSDPLAAARRGAAGAAAALRRRVRALRHGRAHVAAARGRDAVDAAVRAVAARAARTSCAGGSARAPGCRGSRLIPTVANGSPAFGQYRPSGPAAAFEPWALQVLELSDGRIVGFTAFLDTETAVPALRPAARPARVGPPPDRRTRSARAARAVR